MQHLKTKLGCEKGLNRGGSLMARIATRVRAKSRKRSKDPQTDWVCLLVSYGR